MKTITKLVTLLILLGATSAVALAQGPKLRIDSLDRLEDKASKVVEVSLDEKLMGMAMKWLSSAATKDEDAKKALAIVGGIKEIYVRSFEFDSEGQYSLSDVDGLRSQVKGPGWSRLVGVRSKKTGENAEVYLLSQGDKVLGLAIIAADPKELTVVNIVGSIDVERLGDLDGELGIPRIELKRDHSDSGN